MGLSTLPDVLCTSRGWRKAHGRCLTSTLLANVGFKPHLTRAKRKNCDFKELRTSPSPPQCPCRVGPEPVSAHPVEGRHGSISEAPPHDLTHLVHADEVKAGRTAKSHRHESSWDWGFAPFSRCVLVSSRPLRPQVKKAEEGSCKVPRSSEQQQGMGLSTLPGVLCTHLEVGRMHPGPT